MVNEYKEIAEEVLNEQTGNILISGKISPKVEEEVKEEPKVEEKKEEHIPLKKASKFDSPKFKIAPPKPKRKADKNLISVRIDRNQLDRLKKTFGLDDSKTIRCCMNCTDNVIHKVFGGELRDVFRRKKKDENKPLYDC